MIGQTQRRLRQIASYRPKTGTSRPKLGQHFLQDQNYRREILDSLDLRSGDMVIEIGPGRGAMTGLLASEARKVVAIELDRELARKLGEDFSAKTGLRVIGADILSVDLGEICREEGVREAFVFGNLPYYITSPILHHLFTHRASIRSMGLLMQREVSERLTAEPGSRDYGYLTVATQLFTQPEIALHVPPGAFAPPPKVQSCLVTFRMRTRFEGWPEEKFDAFLKFVKACFAQKRKNLPNNLSGRYLRNQVIEALGVGGKSAAARAEELSVDELAGLYDRLNPSK